MTVHRAEQPAPAYVPAHGLLADKVVVITAGPGTVKAEFEIDLPRPRVVQEIRFDPRFTRLYEQIWEALRAEVAEAYARTTRVASAISSGRSGSRGWVVDALALMVRVDQRTDQMSSFGVSG